MKKRTIVAIIALALAGTVQADSISVSKTQWTGAVNLVGDGYGVEPANNWYNTTSGTLLNLTSSAGVVTTMDFVLTNPGGVSTATGGGVYDNTPMRSGNLVYAVDSTLTLSGLSTSFDGSYDIIVYGTGFNAATGGNQGSFSDGTTTYYMQRPVTPNATLTQSTDINSSDGVDEGQYVRFNGLTGDTQTFTVSTVNGNTGIGGFQVVGTVIPEPATLGLLASIGGGLIWVRRKFTI